MKKAIPFVSIYLLLILYTTTNAQKFVHGKDLTDIEKGSKVVRMPNVKFEALDRDFRPKGMQPQRYLPAIQRL